MDATLDAPVTKTWAKIHVEAIDIFPPYAPGGVAASGVIVVQRRADDDSLIDTVRVPMRAATLAALQASTAFKNAIKADVEAALGKTVTTT